jgi:hypothetical protein
MQRLDSDSLCSVISFLCGCDFLRVLHVCRRWSLLRLKPAAWPASRPCSAHSVALVNTFFPLLDIRHPESFGAACIALSTLDTAGVRRLLKLGGLNHLLPVLSVGHTSRTRIGTLGVLLRIGSLDGHQFAPLLGAAGIVPLLVRLLLIPSWTGQYRAAAMLANVLHAAPMQIDEALRMTAPDCPATGGTVGGSACVRALLVMAAAGTADSGSSDAVDALACMVRKGTDTHRRMLLAEGVLPVLVSAIACGGAATAARDPPPSHSAPLPRVLHRIKEIGLLMETARMPAMAAFSSAVSATAVDDNPSVVHASVPSHAAVAAPLAASLRVQLEPLLHHWHPGIRDKIAALLHESTV